MELTTVLYVSSYVFTLLVCVLLAFLPAIPRRKPVAYEPATEPELERALKGGRTSLRLTLYNALPKPLKHRILGALKRGLAVQIVAALVDENFLHTARSNGAEIRLSVAKRSRRLILGAIVDDTTGFAVAHDRVVRTRDLAAVHQLIQEFNRRFAQWTPYDGHTFEGFEAKRLDAREKEFEDDPEVKRILKSGRTYSFVLLGFWVLTLLVCGYGLWQLGSGVWLAGLSLTTFIGSWLLDKRIKRLEHALTEKTVTLVGKSI